MSQNNDDFDPANLDINDPEIQPLLAAHAAILGIPLAEVKLTLQRVVDLPSELGADPLEKLKNFKEITSQIQQLREYHQETIKENPEKANQTFEEFYKEVTALGIETIKKDIKKLNEDRNRLEDLLDE